MDADYFSHEDVIRILKNVGEDVECGACMEIAFTGVTTNQHECKDNKGAVTVTVTPIDPIERLKTIRHESWITVANNGWGNKALTNHAREVYRLCVEIVGKEPNDRSKGGA